MNKLKILESNFVREEYREFKNNVYKVHKSLIKFIYYIKFKKLNKEVMKNKTYI